jgi:hypothetical protein
MLHDLRGSTPKPDVLNVYGPTLGPLGIPMSDRQAFALEARLASLPAEFQEEKKTVARAAISELAAGERTDVS